MKRGEPSVDPSDYALARSFLVPRRPCKVICEQEYAIAIETHR